MAAEENALRLTRNTLGFSRGNQVAIAASQVERRGARDEQRRRQEDVVKVLGNSGPYRRKLAQARGCRCFGKGD